MAYTSIKNPEGNYEVFQDGQRIATGSESVLQNYGLSPTNLTSSANIPQDSITSDVLSGGTPPTVVTPTNTPLTTPDSTDFTPIEATPQETELSGLIKSITETNLTLPAEKATFQAEEEKRLGLEGLKVSETDLFSQLKQQEAEFKNLETEDVKIQQRLQLEATGRGITAGGLAPLEAGELRKNFLRKSEKAAEINVTAALLAGTQNKLLTAQTLLERAVANKYGVKEAELKAKIDNLSLLLQDPLLTIAQTNRANKQLAAQKKKEEDLAKKKTDAQKILEWAVDARKNGATALEAQSIAKIGLSDDPDLQKAFEIYSKFQKVTTDVTATAGSLEEFKLVYGRMPNNIAELNQFTASRGAAGRAPEGARLTGPTSFQEWELAGGLKGTGKTYAEWLAEANVKAPTVAQQTVSEYAARIEQAEPTLTSLQENITKMNIASFMTQVKLPAALQSSVIQQYMQAARNFINAKLRRESGAVISPTEFSEARAQYLPQPGDTAETLKLKKNNRDLVFAALKKAAGPAYSSVSELLGGEGVITPEALRSKYNY